jgi:hypothetical protein
MSRKLKCSITGSWSYCNDERYATLLAKFNGPEGLEKDYQSRAGRALVAKCGSIEDAIKESKEAPDPNKLACIVTGEFLHISNERKKHIMEKRDITEAELRETYVGRVATRLRKFGAGQFGKASFADLSQKDQKIVDKTIKEQYLEGNNPAPSAPKGSRTAPVLAKKSKAPATTVIDSTDPLRKVEGETSNERKNRVRRERRALTKS